MSNRNIKEMMIVLNGQVGPGLKGAASQTISKLDQVNAKMRTIEKKQGTVTRFTEVKAQALSLAAAMEDARAEVRRLEVEMAKSAKPAAGLADQLKVAKREAASLETQFVKQNTTLKVLDRSLTQAGVDTQKLAAHEDKLAKEMSDVKRQSDALKGSLAKTSSGISGFIRNAVGLAAVYLSINQLKDAWKASTEEAMEGQRAYTRLNTLMMNTAGSTQKDVKAVWNYAGSLQKVVAIENDVTAAGASQLATFKMHRESILKLMPAMQNMAVAKYGLKDMNAEKMQTSAAMIGKAFAGNLTALQKQGIVLDKTQKKIMKNGTEAEKAAVLVKVLEGKFGGLAKAMTNTPEGKLERMRVTVADLQEKVGNGLLPVQQKMLDMFVKKLPEIEKLVDKIPAAMDKLLKVMDWLMVKGDKMFTFMSDNWGTLKWVIGTVTGAVVLYQVAVKTAMAINSISTAIETFKALRVSILEAKAANDALTLSGPGGTVAGAGAPTKAGRVMGLLKYLPAFAFTTEETGTQKFGKKLGQKLFPAKKQGKRARGGIVTRPEVSLIGEAGDEAVIPLENHRNRALALWQQAGQALGVGGQSITFAPNISIQGNASRGEIDAAMGAAFDEFRRMMGQLANDQGRRVMA